MTFKELAEKTLKEYPNGIWVHFNSDDPNSDSNERYLDDESYEILEVFLNNETR